MKTECISLRVNKLVSDSTVIGIGWWINQRSKTI